MSGVLPALRQELRIMPAEPGLDGAARWMLFDPVRNAYHVLTEWAYLRLRHWQAEPMENFLSRLNHTLAEPTSEDELQDVLKFLFAHKLVIDPPQNDPQVFTRQARAAQKGLAHWFVHGYLFIKFPLFRPERFLHAAYPFISWIFTRGFALFILLSFFLGTWLTLKQWDVFFATFLQFLSFEGLIFYGLTLIFVKIIHELGHAFTAHHYGTKVPVMGLALLVLFPILYTDTTNAWALTDRKKRMVIDAAGMLSELCLAIIALLLWSFLPDGTARDMAFFVATTSWVMSLIVNLNPMMRFDGYYFLSDMLGLNSLQRDGFATGRWHMRKTLFGIEPEPPADVPLRLQRPLIVYAYATWIYRFFLFIGIALLVHHLFPKAIGIILFCIEIGFFIALPIWRELKNWWSFRMDILQTRRGRIMLVLAGSALIAFFAPLQRTVSAPALLRPAQMTEIYPPQSAEVLHIFAKNGQSVKQGDVLIALRDEALEEDIAMTQARLSRTRAQLARRGVDARDKAASAVLLQAEQRDMRRLASLRAQYEGLTLRAPFDGQISDLSESLRPGQIISRQGRLLRLAQPGKAEIMALPSEAQAGRISPGAAAVFIPDHVLTRRQKAKITQLSPAVTPFITEPLLSGQYGGPIATELSPDSDGRAVPKAALVRISAAPMDGAGQDLRGEMRGKLKIKAEPQSAAQAVGRRVANILIREADF